MRRCVFNLYFSGILIKKAENSKRALATVNATATTRATTYMLIIFIRAVILYVVLLVVMRLMGKRQIGEMQPFEFIITLLIAELACVPMTDVSIPLSYGIVAVLAVFIIHQLMSVLERAGGGVKFAISGKPSVVITPKGVDVSELKKNNLGVNDLIEAMRMGGYFRLDDLSYGIFESNGKFSALENQNAEKGSSFPLLIIENGKIEKGNLEKTGFSQSELLKAAGVKQDALSLKRVEVLTLDGTGDCYLQLKNSPYKKLKIQLKGGIKW